MRIEKLLLTGFCIHGAYLESRSCTLREEIFAGSKFREFCPNLKKYILFLTLENIDSRKLIPAKFFEIGDSRKLIPAKFLNN